MSDKQETFAAGETVRLKSGGPLMTVDKVSGTTVSCIWFEKNKKFSDTFSAHVLEKDDGSMGGYA